MLFSVLDWLPVVQTVVLRYYSSSKVDYKLFWLLNWCYCVELRWSTPTPGVDKLNVRDQYRFVLKCGHGFEVIVVFSSGCNP